MVVVFNYNLKISIFTEYMIKYINISFKLNVAKQILGA